ncbi:unnamed protein product, partial [Vitis vinifera]
MLSLISPRHRNSFRCIQTLLYPFTQSFSTKPFKPIEPEPLSNPIISPNSTSFDHSTVRQTLSCYANDWKRALEFFDWVQTQCGFNHTTDTYNGMIDILGKFFEFDLIWEFNLRDETSYSNLIDALCEYKHVIEAEELFLKESKDLVFNDDVKIYNIILRGWFKMGWGFLRPVFIVWKKMEEQGCSPDACAYNALIDALVQKGMVDLARKYEEEMLAKGLSAKPRVDLGTKPHTE